MDILLDRLEDGAVAPECGAIGAPTAAVKGWRIGGGRLGYDDRGSHGWRSREGKEGDVGSQGSSELADGGLSESDGGTGACARAQPERLLIV